MSPVDFSSQLRRKGKPEERASQLVQIRQRKLRTSSRTRVSATVAATACELELRTIHITDNHTKSQSSRSSWRTTAVCRMHLAVNLDMLDVALGMMAAISVEEKGPASYVVSAVVEHMRAWGRKKVIFRIDGEPAIRSLGVAIQHARSEETVTECRPKYSSPSRGPVENMNKELCGRVRCFRIYLRERQRSWRSRLSLHCCRGWSDIMDGS